MGKRLIRMTLKKKKTKQRNKPTCHRNGLGEISLLLLPLVGHALPWEEGEEASGRLQQEGF